MAELLLGRAGRFRRERLGAVVERVRALRPDHVLITGDLTTTALPAEFADARHGLAPLLTSPAAATVLPGNHDRYTREAVRRRDFETAFGDLLPAERFPWLKRLDDQTAILGLDPARAHLTARGLLPAPQLEAARTLLRTTTPTRRLIVACHYPIAAPPEFRRELAAKRLVNSGPLRDWLQTIGPHLYCCGHVHAAWAFVPEEIPNQLCLNAGAPLMRDPTGRRRPGFLEIRLAADGVAVHHHAWWQDRWETRPLVQHDRFFQVPL